MSLNKIIVNEEVVFFFQDLTDFMYNDLFCFGGFDGGKVKSFNDVCHVGGASYPV